MEQIRKILYLPGLLFLVASAISCNNDFLSKNKLNLYTANDTLYLDYTQSAVMTSLQLPLTSSSDYSVFYQPKWLSFNSMHGKMTNGIIPLSFSIVKDKIPSGYTSVNGTVILDVDDVGLVSFMVIYNSQGSSDQTGQGTSFQCSVTSLNFESLDSKSFTLFNTGQNPVSWQITGIPVWLNISPSSGLLSSGYSISVSATPNSNNITVGQNYSASLQIVNNSGTGSLTIAVNLTAIGIHSGNEQSIDGIVTDAEYNHENGIMAICTKSPNSLIIINTNTDESHTISFDKTPNCVSISEDGHKAVVGYSVSYVSSINIDSLKITRDYSINCIPYDIVFGENGWCYITPTVDQWVFFRSLNLNSGVLINGTNQSMLYEKTIIRKIPGKPYLVGTRTTLSPSGILIFDITKGRASDTISYYHESTGNIWISEDGSKLYAGNRNVYNLPAYDYQYHVNAPPLFGQIESASSITSLDECPSINSIFSTYAYSDISGYSSLIEQSSTLNLNKTKEFYASITAVTENGIKSYYESTVWYIFVNKSGSNLYAIKNLKSKYNKNYWVIETIQLH